MKIDNIYKDETLCDMHDLITENLEELKDNLNLKENEAEIKWIDKIIAYVAIAKTKGQTMEDRLYIYRQTIEGLGFKRVYEEEGDNY